MIRGLNEKSKSWESAVERFYGEELEPGFMESLEPLSEPLVSWITKMPNRIVRDNITEEFENEGDYL